MPPKHRPCQTILAYQQRIITATTITTQSNVMGIEPVAAKVQANQSYNVYTRLGELEVQTGGGLRGS